MRNKLFCLFLLALWCLSPLRVSGQDDIYRQLKGMTSRQLVDKGNKYFFATSQQPDSALACFTLVVNRTDKNSGQVEREELCEAYMGLWMVYFFSYFDYSKSISYLEESKALAENIPALLPRVLLNYGNMYQTMGTQWKDNNLNKKAADSFRASFYAAAKVKQYDIASLSFANIIGVEYNLGRFQVVEEMHRLYRNYEQNKAKNIDSEYTEYLYQGYKLLSRKKYTDAVGMFEKQLGIVSERPEYLRLLFNTYENISIAYAGADNFQMAIKSMQKAERLAHVYDIKDGKLEAYSYLAEFYEDAGDKNVSDSYHRKYYMLKDSLQNYQQVMGVSRLEFLEKIEHASQQIVKMRQTQRIGIIAFIVLLSVAVVVAASFYVVYRKNRELQLANRVLYKKNIEVQGAEKKLREIHRNDAKKNVLNGDMQRHNAERNIESVADVEKYKNSVLSEDDKDKLMARITETMENCDDLFKPDFNINSLARMLGTNYKYVSQVINERTNGNFSTFVNNYRIREACQRINDGIMQNYTVEALSSSVGFKSRMTFFKAFKLQTGLSPSEYIRQSKEASHTSTL